MVVVVVVVIVVVVVVDGVVVVDSVQVTWFGYLVRKDTLRH